MPEWGPSEPNASMPVERKISKFVAIGDSQTEGVGDFYPDGSERGWADRFADNLARSQPDLLYANLAVRGKKIAEIREKQLAAAIEQKPDLVSLIAGLNDMIRPGFQLSETIAHMDDMQAALRNIGARVLSITYPDPQGLAPIGRFLHEKTMEFNQELRRVAAKNDVLLLDLESTPITSDPRFWCADRLHLNPEGHRRLAVGMASLVTQPGEDWLEPLPSRPEPGRLRRTAIDLHWGWAFFMPWVGRRIVGRSSGDGREAKRPQLLPVSPGYAQAAP
mgnify:CR=1 FL=1